MNKHTDIVIIGAGIIGLAHAYAAIQKGYKVLVLEKEQFSVGASVRNFGLIWPIGQPAGNLYDRTMRSREIWLNLSKLAGYWALESGSFHLAYAQDEFDIIEEYHTKFGSQTHLMSPKNVLEKSNCVIQNGLMGGLYSQTELNVNPKEAISSIAAWLQKQELCDIKYGEKVVSIQHPIVETTLGSYQADKVLVCTGSDFQSLYPDIFAKSGLTKSKLQMLRTKAQSSKFSLGPVLCGGLTLRHYASFAQCNSLEAYSNRISNESPEFDKWGIHVMISQNEHNEMIIGDSHEYGLTFDPFDKSEINDLILNYLQKFVALEHFDMLETWHGVYAKNPNGTEYVHEVENDVKIITGFGGAGMTFSFGYATEEVDRW